MKVTEAQHKAETKDWSFPECGCGQTTEQIFGKDLYPHLEALADRLFYICHECEAWVGTHEGTDQALGTPATAAHRRLRTEAHARLDLMWKRKMVRDGVSKKVARGAAYEWLGKQLGVKPWDCHIGMFNETLCRKTIDLCSKYGE